MTTRTVAAETAALAAPTAAAPELTARQELAKAIIAEAGAKGVNVDETVAEGVIALLERVALQGYVYVEEVDMVTLHPALDAVMVDDTLAEPSSAHALAEQLLLQPGQRFVHTKQPDANRIQHCTVLVQVPPID